MNERLGVWTMIAMAAAVIPLATACADDGAEPDAGACPPGACGLVDGFDCGACPAGRYCASYGRCEEPCRGWECGEDHGFPCGQCAEGEVCASNRTCVDPLEVCGPEMVAVPGTTWCIDRWTASAGPGGAAVSAPGAQPWTAIKSEDAMAACLAAGKELCPEPVWLAACEGPGGGPYPYGAEFVEDACNFGSGAVAATGEYALCEGGLPGLFDMLGNAWEWVAACVRIPGMDRTACRLLGGSSEQDADPGFVCSTRYSTFNGSGIVSGSSPTGGFRCCKAL